MRLKHLIWTLIGLVFMAAIGVFATYIVSNNDEEISAKSEKGRTSISSFISSIIDRINK